LKYFDELGWLQEWQDKAHKLLEDTFGVYEAAFTEQQDNDSENMTDDLDVFF